MHVIIIMIYSLFCLGGGAGGGADCGADGCVVGFIRTGSDNL